MKVVVALLLVAVTLQGASGAEKLYQAGKIIDVQQKTNTRILYYVVNTPVTKDEPYYEVSVQLKDTIYLGRYTPRHSDETLPEEWQPGAPVEARVDGHHLFLRRPSGADMEFAIAKRTAVKSQQTSQPAPVEK